MNIQGMKDSYWELKAKAVREREKLEEMRTAFSAQCSKVENLETDVSNLKRDLANALMEQEGLTP